MLANSLRLTCHAALLRKLWARTACGFDGKLDVRASKQTFEALAART